MGREWRRSILSRRIGSWEKDRVPRLMCEDIGCSVTGQGLRLGLLLSGQPVALESLSSGEESGVGGNQGPRPET